MEKTVKGGIPRTNTKPRKLPEIPKDQEPYDVLKPPRKPPRQIPRRSSSPVLRRLESTAHKRFSFQTDSGVSSVKFIENTEKSRTAGEKDDTFCNNSSVVIFSRRCGSCYQRIFQESEEYLVAQFQVFHAACFCCAICNVGLDITNYCYVMHHGKFYCFQHCREVSEAEERLGNEEKEDINEVGPGAFGGSVIPNVIYEKRLRKQITKKIIEFQHRRATLEKVAMQYQETLRTAEREDKLLLWKHWCDVSYEKIMIMRGVTELAYQLKEGELLEEQEQLQKRLRRSKKQRDEGTREENNKQEDEFVRCILDVIEKRDLLLLELEIERRRDDAEVQKLKSKFEQTDIGNENSDNLSTGISSCELRDNNHNTQANEQCLIL